MAGKIIVGARSNYIFFGTYVTVAFKLMFNMHVKIVLN